MKDTKFPTKTIVISFDCYGANSGRCFLGIQIYYLGNVWVIILYLCRTCYNASLIVQGTAVRKGPSITQRRDQGFDHSNSRTDIVLFTNLFVVSSGKFPSDCSSKERNCYESNFECISYKLKEML